MRCLPAFGCCLMAFVTSLSLDLPAARGADPIRVGAPLDLASGDDLSNFTTWLKGTGRDDPHGAFSISDGVIHVSGEGAGYLATKDSFADYHLSLEYRWGRRNDGSGYVRNSGVLLHGTGPDGAANGVWMSSIEVQLAQGCEGDFIVIRGKGGDAQPIPVTLTSDTRIAEDGRTRWHAGGKPTSYSGRQFWWNRHEAGFRELLDARGRDDVASPLGEWTRVECLCRADRITVKINGATVNECYGVFPTAGKILLQNEGNEVYFRRVRVSPLPKE